MNQLVSVTARADTDGITLTGRFSGGLARTTLGVIGGPVAKTAVVAAAVTPGPSPLAKAAVVGAALVLQYHPVPEL